MADLFDVDPSKFNPQGVLFDPFTHVRNFQEAQAKANLIREQIGGLMDYTLNGNYSVLRREVWKPVKEQPPSVCPADIMGPLPPIVEVIEVDDDDDSDSEIEVEESDVQVKGPRRVRFAPLPTKKRGTARAARKPTKKPAGSRKAPLVKKGTAASRKSSRAPPKKAGCSSNSQPQRKQRS